MRELGAPDNWTGGAGWTNGGVGRLRRPALAEAHRMQQPNGFEWRKGVERPGAAARSTQTDGGDEEGRSGREQEPRAERRKRVFKTETNADPTAARFSSG